MAIYYILINCLELVELLSWEIFLRKVGENSGKSLLFRILGGILISGYIIGMYMFSGNAGINGILSYIINNTVYVCYFIYAVLFYSIPKKTIFTYLAAKFILDTLSEYIITLFLLGFFKFGIDTLLQANIVRLIAIVLLKSSGIMFLFMLIKAKEKYRQELENNKLFYIILIGFLADVTTFGASYSCASSNELMLFNPATAMMFIFETIILGYSIYCTIDYKKKEVEYLEVINFTNSQMKMLNDTQEKVKKSQKSLHDVINHLSTIECMAEKNMCKEISQYVEKLIPEVKKDRLSEVSNTVLAIIIYEKKARAKKEGVYLETIIGVEDIRIPMMELNAIVTNILDNAIEACMKIRNKKERRIEFRVYVRESNLFMECRNPYTVEPRIQDNGLLATTKADKKEHGKGIGIIYDYVERNGGDVDINFKDGEFLIKIILSNKIAIQ